ncbi:SDR family NAD(P)-dependent oxidoreductase [Amnibacterium sp. CER49]|uniref:SDR family NAD(P)-dependent oxidoreductase n=1 Tax=Amnibacterium sp. CER49 TaxID=3039161 RepID=UPI002448147A|nr:SDR family NAD(P)-dependent oxidoreductase [Amnibacterium sp. CER49]MDH2444102.1 SDR family NAD(P)-dependent oxidoreductase [Amnibacterium sp. CER49]
MYASASAGSRSEQRNALVTGAGSGIGAAIAEALARSGCAVVCTDRNEAGADATAARIRAAGGSAASLPLDIADDSAVATLPEKVVAGLGAIDVLVNNAGVGGEVPTSGLTMADVRAVLRVNLEGAVAVTLALLPQLRASGSGRVLNVASIQGFRGARDSLAYGASKGALVNLTRDLACDLADDGVLVNALAPGFVNTPMARYADGTTEYETDWFRTIYVENARIPLRRPAEPEEVAEAALFLCSPANTYVTGQVLAVDGGMTATF